MSTPYRRNAKTPAGRIAATPSTANWGGFRGLLKKYPGAAAAYSLRKIGSGPVVRLRRASDNAEKDFYAGEVIGSSESSELVTNGDFATDSDWTKGTGWSITGGQAVCDGTNVTRSFISQNGIYPSPTPWIKITFTVVACSDFTNAGFFASASSLSTFSSREITTTGTYSIILDRSDGGTANFRFFTEAGVTLTVDDASCVTYTPTAAELWALENVPTQGSRQTTDSAYAATWYDQSGSGNDATQSTAASQPLLVRAGVTNTENGKAALSFDGTDDGLIFSGPISSSAADYYGSVAGAVSAGGYLIYGSNQSTIMGFGASSGYWNNAPRGTGTWKSSTQQLSTWSLVATDQAATFINGVDDQSGLTYSQQEWGIVANQCSIMFKYDGTSHSTGNLQEVIVYPSDQTSNRIGIETNINDHYGIY